MNRFDVLIVGSGHAGAQAAILLRQYGFTGRVGIAGAEAELPYERPPLSKDYLAGDKAFERMLIRPEAFWTERDIALLAGTRITSIDAARKVAVTEAGDALAYGTMIWAAGGTPRRLVCDGSDLAGVHVVRCRAEVDAIRSELPSVERVAVIGGGYIGLETAAVLRALGKQVVLIEAQDRLLARVAAEPISRFYEDEHRARGIEVRLSANVQCIEDHGGRSRSVRLADGSSVDAEMVIVGVGIAPSVEPLIDAGAAGGNGVDVDPYCRTSLPYIFAIGDCARHQNPFGDGSHMRVESVQNAHDQAATAVKAIVGTPEPYHAIPWFWSNQYDLKLQTVGLSTGHERTILRGNPANRSFSLVYLRQGRVIALDCVNATRDYAQGRKLILDGSVVDPERLADPNVPLKDLLHAQPAETRS